MLSAFGSQEPCLGVYSNISWLCVVVTLSDSATMTKTKSARLSLTLPNSIQLPGAQTLSPSTGGSGSYSTPTSPRRIPDIPHDSNGHEREAGHRIIPRNTTSSSAKESGGHSASPEMNPVPHEAHPVSHKLYADSQKPPTSPRSPISPTFTSLPQFPTSPGATPKHARDPSKSFFANLKASKSSIKIQNPESTIRKVSQEPNEDMPRIRRKASATSVSHEITRPIELTTFRDSPRGE